MYAGMDWCTTWGDMQTKNIFKIFLCLIDTYVHLFDLNLMVIVLSTKIPPM